MVVVVMVQVTGVFPPGRRRRVMEGIHYQCDKADPLKDLTRVSSFGGRLFHPVIVRKRSRYFSVLGQKCNKMHPPLLRQGKINDASIRVGE